MEIAMKLVSLSLLVSVWVVSQGRAIASPWKMSQINIPVPTVDEAVPAPQPNLSNPQITPVPQPNLPNPQITPVPPARN